MGFFEYSPTSSAAILVMVTLVIMAVRMLVCMRNFAIKPIGFDLMISYKFLSSDMHQTAMTWCLGTIGSLHVTIYLRHERTLLE